MKHHWYSWASDQLTLQIHLQPGARKDEYCNLFNNRLRIKIKAPAVAGQANKYLARLLATAFATPITRIKITRGRTSRDKTVQIQSPGSLPEWFLCLSSNTVSEKAVR